MSMKASEGAAPQKKLDTVKMSDAGHQEALAAEAEREPVRGGKDDRVGDEVAGEDPGGFFVGGGKRAGDVEQSNRCDGGIEHLHEGSEHDRGMAMSHGFTPWVSSVVIGSMRADASASGGGCHERGRVRLRCEDFGCGSD